MARIVLINLGGLALKLGLRASGVRQISLLRYYYLGTDLEIRASNPSTSAQTLHHHSGTG